MIVKQLLDKIDRIKCILDLVTLHRKFYYEPGYILSCDKITDLYTNVFDRITEYRHTTESKTIIFEYDTTHKTYNVTVEGKALRDWFIENNYPYETLYNMQIIKPKQLENISVLIEIIFEITYYSFPETVENTV